MTNDTPNEWEKRFHKKFDHVIANALHFKPFIEAEIKLSRKEARQEEKEKFVSVLEALHFIFKDIKTYDEDGEIASLCDMGIELVGNGDTENTLSTRDARIRQEAIEECKKCVPEDTKEVKIGEWGGTQMMMPATFNDCRLLTLENMDKLQKRYEAPLRPREALTK